MEDIASLQQVEQSAAKAFLKLQGFEWVAQMPPITALQHQEFIENAMEWLMEDAGKILAFIATIKHGAALHISELSVAENVQRKGIGKKLLEWIDEYARLNNYKTITLTTFKNVPFSRQCYETNGFKTSCEDMSFDPRESDLLKKDRVNMVKILN